jgi:hypothetical protein
MYLLRQSIFGDIIVACGEGGACYVRYDGLKRLGDVRVRAEAWNLSQPEPAATWWWIFRHPSHRLTAAFLSRFQLPCNWTKQQADVVLLDVFDSDNEAKLADTSAFLWKKPADLVASEASLKVVSSMEGADSSHRKEFQVVSDRLVLYVVFSSKAAGRFDYNAFHVRPNEKRVVVFEGVDKNDTIDVDLLERSLRVEHLLKYSIPSHSAESVF